MRFFLPALLFLAVGCTSAPKVAPAAGEEAKYGTVKETYDTFRKALARDDFEAAYESLTKETRDRYPQRLFSLAFNMTATGQRYRNLLARSELVTSIEKSDGVSAVAVLRGHDVDSDVADPGREHFVMKTFRMKKEEERWLVAFTLEEFFGIKEDLFFDFEQVAEKRDFRHRR